MTILKIIMLYANSHLSTARILDAMSLSTGQILLSMKSIESSKEVSVQDAMKYLLKVEVVIITA